jgi:UDP-N-acetylmuramoyl-tripeptide--D-alanyl-D-alanine ligase
LLSEGISSISRDNIRQKIVSAGGYLFYNDSYNASLESIVASFDSVKNIDSAKRKSLLLGDVLELGDMSEKIHRKIGELISKELFDNVFLFGDYAKFTADAAIKNGFPAKRIHINDDLQHPDISALQIKCFCSTDELILLKGSRGVRLERILDYLEKGENSD